MGRMTLKPTDIRYINNDDNSSVVAHNIMNILFYSEFLSLHIIIHYVMDSANTY